MLEKIIDVRTSAEHAFRVWTERVGTWWPPAHRLSGTTDGVLTLEAGVGGRFMERLADGREFHYGRVTAWEPPSSLAFDFYPGSGAAKPTHVVVDFAETEGGTRVTVRHYPGALTDETFEKTAIRYRASWEHVAEAFVRAIDGVSPSINEEDR